jgi:hypothetical protein
MATPSLTTLVNPVGRPVSGVTVNATQPLPNVPNPAGRNTGASIASIRNQYIILNNVLSSARFWQGQLYNEAYQSTPRWRRNFFRTRIDGTFADADLPKDCDLWKNYNENPAAVPKFISENNINNTMNGESISDLNKLIDSSSGLRRTRGFRNSKDFWQNFPPQVGHTQFSNKENIQAIEMYLTNQLGMENPKYSNKAGDTLTMLENQVGNIKKDEGPLAWVQETGGIGEEWVWMRPFWRISRNWLNYDKFKFDYDEMTDGTVGYNPYVIINFFEQDRGDNWIYKPDYFHFGNTSMFKISNDTPPGPTREERGEGLDRTVPGFDPINQGAFTQTTEQIVVPYYDKEGNLLKDEDLGYISDDGSTYIQSVYDEDNNRIVLKRKILRKEKYYKTDISLIDQYDFPNTLEGLRERYKDYNGGKGLSEEELKRMIIDDEDRKIEKVQLEYTPELSRSLIERVRGDEYYDPDATLRTINAYGGNPLASPGSLINPNRRITEQQQRVETMTKILYDDFVKMYGKELTNQIQMPIDTRQNSSRFYFQLAGNIDPAYKGNKILSSPNQFLYNIAVEYIKGRYFWSVPDRTWDLSYLNDIILPQNRIWDGTMYGGQGGYRFP